MRIGLASDCHGNVDALARALEHFQEARVDRIFFLGGRFADVDAALALAKVRPSDAVAEAEAHPDSEGFVPVFRGVLAAHAVGPDDDRERLRKKIVRVASRTCPEYAAGAAPGKLMELLEGRVACLVHDKSELTRDDIANAPLLFHGNSAQAAIVQIGPRIFVTPGSLAPAPDGRPPTWGVVELDPRGLTLVVYDTGARELRRERVELGGRARMVVQ
ncbi:MAG TPA: metallophosphoesterase family protein [Anaeromyxobacteraceae bacterium]|nr:metallophosphoesterase family protein [Anaeromyxobacteraceae bacterium]